MDTKPLRSAPASPAKRVLPPRPVRAAFVIGSFTALLYLINLVDLGFYHGDLERFGIRPRTLGGLDGVAFAPLLHGSWQHLAGNTIPVLVFGFLAMAGGLGQWIAVTSVIWLFSGMGVWLISPGGSPTIGASGIAFGWLAFLLVRGLFNRSFGQIVIALVLLFYWGSVLWGLLPGRPEISWQAHAFGALGGVLAAWLAARATPKSSKTTATPSGPGMPGNLAA